MRHSIAKTFTLLMALIIMLSALVVMVISCITTYAFVHVSYIDSTVTASLTISDYNTRLLDDDLDDSKRADNIKELAEQICKNSELAYCYIYTPNVNSNTITYICCYSNSSNESFAKKVMKDRIRSHKLTEAEKNVWYGKEEYALDEYGNDFGNVIACYSPILDKDKNVVAIVSSEVMIGEVFNAFIDYYLQFAGITFFVFILILIMVFLVFNAKVSHPARLISQKMNDFIEDGAAHFEKIVVKGDNEFTMIGNSFNDMTDNIRNYLDSINQLNEVQNQQKAEIRVASEIQRGLLPPTHFENKLFNIDAVMIPAKYIGGDFYDYFTTKDGKVAVVIADVSGKGVSAAMFMSRTITAIRDFASRKSNPAQILKDTNNLICTNNPQMMFVTAFIGVLDKNCKTMTYANAGHNPPYIIGGGKITLLNKSKSIPLGIFEDKEYVDSTVDLDNGSTLFLYTDGVNEAVNDKGEFFGVEELENLLLSNGGSPTGRLVDNILSKLNDFEKNTEQSDDITMLSLVINYKSHIRVKAVIENLPQIQDKIQNNEHIPQKLKFRLCLVAEEIFVNICSYAYPESLGEVDFTLWISDKIVMKFEDSGIPYNPTKNVITPEEYDIEQVGGLGKLISLRMSDDISYEYKDEKNILTVTMLFE